MAGAQFTLARPDCATGIMPATLATFGSSGAGSLLFHAYLFFLADFVTEYGASQLILVRLCRSLARKLESLSTRAMYTTMNGHPSWRSP